MITKIFGSVRVGEEDVPIVGDANVVYDDRSFDHEFGTERDGSWEIESIDNIQVDGQATPAQIEAVAKAAEHLGERMFTEDQIYVAIGRAIKDNQPDE